MRPCSQTWRKATAVGDTTKAYFKYFHIYFLYFFIPQQRKLMGSSAQISSGVCRCGSQEQVPERGSGGFQCVLV